MPSASDERQLLDLALDHDPLGVLRRDRALVDDELLDGRHPVGDAQVAGRARTADRARSAAPRACRSSSTTTSVPTRERAISARRLVHGRGRRDAVGIADHAVLRALDDLDFAHLRLDVAGAEPAIDDPDAALLGLHDGHRRPRDRVHVGRHDRPAQREVLRHAAGQIDRGRIAARDDAAAAGSAGSRRRCSRGRAPRRSRARGRIDRGETPGSP